VQFDVLLIIFILFSVASYLLLDRHLVNIIIGFVLLSNGANLFLLSLSGDPGGKAAPVLGQFAIQEMLDPLTQAMILTAIVIGFGMLSFFAALIYKVYVIEKTEDVSDFQEEDQ